METIQPGDGRFNEWVCRFGDSFTGAPWLTPLEAYRSAFASGWHEGNRADRAEPVGLNAGIDQRGKILDDAREVTTGDRQRFYGHPLDNHGCEADLWTAWLHRKYGAEFRLTAEDVSWLMVLLKAAREANLHKRDNALDGIGYLENAEECRLERLRRAEKVAEAEQAKRMREKEEEYLSGLANRPDAGGIGEAIAHHHSIDCRNAESFRRSGADPKEPK